MKHPSPISPSLYPAGSPILTFPLNKSRNNNCEVYREQYAIHVVMSRSSKRLKIEHTNSDNILCLVIKIKNKSVN